MTDTPDWITLDAYFANQASLDERASVDAWLAAHPEHPAQLAAWRRAWAAKGHGATRAWDGRTAAETVLAAITRESAARRANTSQASAGTLVTPRRMLPRRWTTVASALAVLAIAFLGFTYSNGHVSLGVTASTTYTTNPGEQLTVTLDDATRVVLGPASRLTIDGRTATLAGLATFAVQHQSGTPFTVTANDVKTTVLGTEFNIRAYPGDGDTRVAVRSGRVAVQPRALTVANAVVLNQGEMVAVTSSGDTKIHAGRAVERDFSWHEGTLVFLDAPLSVVLPELSRWSGWDVRVSDPALLKRLLTTKVGVQVGDVELRAIADALEARIERDPVRRTVTLVPIH